jgi:hypothetical protein
VAVAGCLAAARPGTKEVHVSSVLAAGGHWSQLQSSARPEVAAWRWGAAVFVRAWAANGNMGARAVSRKLINNENSA